MGRDIRVERTYAHPPAAVWRALTDRQALRAWFGPTDFQPELEANLTRFSLRGYEGDDSPDPADAHGWAGNELIRGAGLVGWGEINAVNA